MFKKADNNALWAIGIGALVLFFIGGMLTTVVPPLVDTTWAKPFENHDPAKGPTGKLKPYTELELKGRAIYVREGCWYCHTQQTRTLLADTKRSGWKGVDSPISTPDEFVLDDPAHVRHQAHRPGPRPRRRKVRRAVAPHPLPQSRPIWCPARSCRRSPGSPNESSEEFKAMVAYLQTLGRAKDWRPDSDYEK